jgi:hypothetical protein
MDITSPRSGHGCQRRTLPSSTLPPPRRLKVSSIGDFRSKVWL